MVASQHFLLLGLGCATPNWSRHDVALLHYALDAHLDAPAQTADYADADHGDGNGEVEATERLFRQLDEQMNAMGASNCARACLYS